jgi:hypothetical protein
VRGKALTVSAAAAEAAGAGYGPLDATDARARFAYANDRLSFDTLRFAAAGGTWTHSGWFTVDPGGPFSGQLAIEGANPHDLQAMFGNPGVNLDFTRLDLDSEFDSRATADWLRQLRATGSVSVHDGTLPSTVVLRAIWEALMGPGRVTDALQRLDPRTEVSEVSATFDLRDGQIGTSDLWLASDDYEASAVGTVGLDGTMDLGARIRLTSRGFQKMLVLGSMPLPTGILPDMPAIPTSITGTLAAPVIRPNVAALPAATARWLIDAILHTPQTVGDALVNRLGKLWSRTKRATGAIGNLVRPAE